MNDLISIIIPAFNNTCRIRQALESVAAQTYENIEIIIINDGSSDNTSDIAREYLDSQSRPYIIITHDHNRGVSTARNTGLAAAHGKYVTFMDSDDLLEREFIITLRNIIAGNDIAFCGAVERFGSRPDEYIKPGHSQSNGEEIILSSNVPPLWCCMFKANFLKEHNLLFHEGCTSGEDVEFTTKAFCVAKSIAFTQSCMYIYIHHDNMGSVRDNDTRMKKALRYEHNTYAQRRTAEYLIEHARSDELKRFSEDILLPQSMIRMFMLYAMRHDKAGYDNLLHDDGLMKTLNGTQSLYVLRKKPELFLKAFAILHAPDIYYRIRER